MKQIKNGLLLVTGLLIGYGTALSVTAAYAQGMPFHAMDADKNGMVSEQEFNNAMAQRLSSRAAQGGAQMRAFKNAPTFSSIDTNNDGQLTPDELQNMRQSRQNSRMQHNNMAQGNTHTPNTMGKPPMPVFADFDSNHDQLLSEAEFYEARNRRISERAKEGRQMRGLANIASFADIDVNADGTITQQEFLSFRQSHMRKGHP